MGAERGGRDHDGRGVARLYAANTAGAIVGSLVAALLLITLLGTQGAHAAVETLHLTSAPTLGRHQHLAEHEREIELALEIHDQYVLTLVHGNMGLAVLLDGRPQAARAAFRAEYESAHRHGYVRFYFEAQLGLAAVAVGVYAVVLLWRAHQRAVLRRWARVQASGRT